MGGLRSLLARLSRIDVLIIDDESMPSLSQAERRGFREICQDRYQVRSTIITSQLPVSEWHEQIGDSTLADCILDRLVHSAHRIEMRGGVAGYADRAASNDRIHSGQHIGWQADDDECGFRLTRLLRAACGKFAAV